MAFGWDPLADSPFNNQVSSDTKNLGDWKLPSGRRLSNVQHNNGIFSFHDPAANMGLGSNGSQAFGQFDKADQDHITSMMAPRVGQSIGKMATAPDSPLATALAAQPMATKAIAPTMTAYGQPEQSYFTGQNDALERARKATADLKFNRMANPYGPDNTGLQSLLATNRGQYGGSLASALNDARADRARRGITDNSALAANQDLQTRLMAAKGLNAMDTAATTDNYNRGAAFDQWQNGLENQFRQTKAQLANANSFQEIGALQQMLNQQNTQAMQPYQLDAARLTNQRAGTELDFLRPTLQQGLQQQGYQTQEMGRQNEYGAANLPAAIERLRWEYDNRWNTRSREAINNGIDDFLKLPTAGAKVASSFIGLGGGK